MFSPLSAKIPSTKQTPRTFLFLSYPMIAHIWLEDKLPGLNGMSVFKIREPLFFHLVGKRSGEQLTYLKGIRTLYHHRRHVDHHASGHPICCLKSSLKHGEVAI